MFTGFWLAAPFIAELLLRIVLVGVILSSRRSRPTAMLAWIVVVLAVPVVGLIVYLLIGRVQFSERRMLRHREIVARNACAQLTGSAGSSIWQQIDKPYLPIAQLADVVGDHPPVAGNELELISDTGQFVDSLIRDINAAERFCHLEFYIFLMDETSRKVGEAMIQAANRGVAARLLVDGVGARVFLRSDLRQHMEAGGVRIVEMLPANLLRLIIARVDLRNHRKIAVIDGRIGYTGSQNIADAEFAEKKRFAPWVDTMVRMAGPITTDLHRLFVDDWYMDTDESLVELLCDTPPEVSQGVIAQVIGTGPNAFNDAMKQLTHAALHTAQEELILTTPYFIPDETVATALRTAARRGVATKVVLPGRNDSPLVAAASRSYYESLLEAGVEIFEYTGGMLHAKTLTIDRTLALIGSANLDRRSFELNFEVSLVVYDSDFASALRFLQQSYVSQSQEVRYDLWQRRGWPRRLFSNAAGLLSPLL